MANPMLYVLKTRIDATAMILALSGIHRFSCQLRMIGPNILCSVSHRCHFSDELAKQVAASRSKGVVGSNGRKMPSVASPTSKKPATRNSPLRLSAIYPKGGELRRTSKEK